MLASVCYCVCVSFFSFVLQELWLMIRSFLSLATYFLLLIIGAREVAWFASCKSARSRGRWKVFQARREETRN